MEEFREDVPEETPEMDYILDELHNERVQKRKIIKRELKSNFNEWVKKEREKEIKEQSKQIIKDVKGIIKELFNISIPVVISEAGLVFNFNPTGKIARKVSSKVREGQLQLA